MTPLQIDTAKALAHCTFLPGSADKRFARDMAFDAENRPDRELTARQAWNLNRLAWRYRRQMPARLVPAEKPSDPPPGPASRQKAGSVRSEAEQGRGLFGEGLDGATRLN